MKSQKSIIIWLGWLILASLIFSACGPAAVETSAPVSPPATQAPAANPTPEPDARYGGILRHALQPASNLDPAFLGSVPDDEVARQWHDPLIYIGEENDPDLDRSIAESYTFSEDGLEWTFKLRQGIKFHDGKEMTSRDVVFTFDRLRDPEIGASTVGLFTNITSIEAPDDYTVVFQLENPNPDFLKDLGDYHALIVDADSTDFATQWNGTGPFILKSYNPEDRIVFERNPNYWLKDSDGNQLPYLDGMEFIFIPDTTAQMEALRGGQIHYVSYLPAEFVSVLEQENLVVYQRPSNTAYIIRMRSDREPAGDNNVRTAFKLATDTTAILEGAFEGLGVAGGATPFGPIYGDFYLDEQPEHDLDKARELLAEAGYADGLTIDLACQNVAPVSAICTIWQEQLAAIGVTVNVNLVPSDVYYGADNMWLEADFGVTDWGSRPYPQPYLDLAYTCEAAWNESHWCDEELDDLAAQAAQEMDPATRAALYKDIQRIFNERGPIIVAFFLNNLWGATPDMKGVVPTMGLGTGIDLRYVYLEN